MFSVIDRSTRAKHGIVHGVCDDPVDGRRDTGCECRVPGRRLGRGVGELSHVSRAVFVRAANHAVARKISTTSFGATDAWDAGLGGADLVSTVVSAWGAVVAQPVMKTVATASDVARTTRALSFDFIVTCAT
jgi:hypothetical protein